MLSLMKMLRWAAVYRYLCLVSAAATDLTVGSASRAPHTTCPAFTISASAT